MKKIIIEGNKELSGKIKIGGAKNSLVALLPAAVLSNGNVTINNVPQISDKNALLEIFEYLGAEIKIENTSITINSENVQNKAITKDLCEKLRASYYFMGALLAKYNYAEVYMPGGCKIGARPIDIHLEGFKKLGADVIINEDKYIIKADKLVGAEIPLDFPSVGATINIMFAAVKAEGKTIITNAAKEVEIINIGNLLQNMGAKIEGLGTSEIIIEGVNYLSDAEISVIPDRIEGGTYIILGALLGKDFTVEGFVPEYSKNLLDQLDMMEIKYEIGDNQIKINKANFAKSVDIISKVHPGFPTDLGQPMHVLLTQAQGVSTFTETIYENRMLHIKYLTKMGANIKVEGNKAIITGKTNLVGAQITADDLRGGAALVLAGLIAEGTTVINDVDYILRGYENIINKLTEIGANIRIEEI
ncbi:MAG: UDP-N-acetylglucosamine 1-carboxyvinyltransferase [bacterium]